MNLLSQARADIGALCEQLAQRGYSVSECQMGHMHSYLVRFVGPTPLVVACDRGQLFVGGERRASPIHGLGAVGVKSISEGNTDLTLHAGIRS